MSQNIEYTAGRDSAYAEIYAALDDLDHARKCDACRPCEVMKATLEWMMQGLSRRLSQEEFYTLARVLKSAEGKVMAEFGQGEPAETG